MSGWFSKEPEVWQCDSCSWRRPVDAPRIDAEAQEHEGRNRGHIIYKGGLVAPPQTHETAAIDWWSGWLWFLFLVTAWSSRLVSGANLPREAGLVLVLVASLILAVGLVRIVVLRRKSLLAIVGIRGRPGPELGFRRVAAISSIVVFSAALLLNTVDALSCIALATVPWGVFYLGRWVVSGFVGH
jgi:hypothetical protein